MREKEREGEGRKKRREDVPMYIHVCINMCTQTLLHNLIHLFFFEITDANFKKITPSKHPLFHQSL